MGLGWGGGGGGGGRMGLGEDAGLLVQMLLGTKASYKEILALGLET